MNDTITWSYHAPCHSPLNPLLGSWTTGQTVAATDLSITWAPAAAADCLPVEAISALQKALEAKDPHLYSHSANVAAYAELMGQALGWPEERCREVYYCGFFHDVGKIGIADAILHKPGRLSPAERRIMVEHPAIGARILSGIPSLNAPMLAALCHQELYDGTGYPRGLAGESIPLLARVVTIVDTFEAMSTNRIYRRARPLPDILEEIRRLRGSHFDPALTDVFLRLVETPPFQELLARNRQEPRAEDGGQKAEEALAPSGMGQPGSWLERLARLAEAGRKLNQASESATILALVAQSARALLGADCTCAWLLQGEILAPRGAEGWPQNPPDVAVSAGDEDLSSYVTYRQMSVAVPDFSQELRFEVSGYLRRSGIRAALATPILLRRQLLGVLAVYFNVIRTFDDADVAMLSVLADQAAVALENAGMVRATERAAHLDPLTGTRNHRYFQELLKRELLVAERAGYPLSVVALDIEGFANFNEAHGYAIGDEALRLLAQVLQKGVRAIDTVGRYSGDSFVILQPGLPGQAAAIVARDLRRAVLHTAFPRRELAHARIVVQTGVASFPEDGTTARKLVERALARLGH